ncbi:hypothetical protein J2780_003265 [Chryseobacterium camelliae]|nr:hypothetical protein [Chryseobacterium camelliae]
MKIPIKNFLTISSDNLEEFCKVANEKLKM